MNVLKQLLKDMKSIPIYSKEEIRDLAICKEQGDKQAREQLILSIMPWAIRLATKYQKAGVPLEDLIQLAFWGVIDSVDKYDYRKACLTTYASFHIKRRIFQRIKNNSIILIPQGTTYDNKHVNPLNRKQAKRIQLAQLASIESLQDSALAREDSAYSLSELEKQQQIDLVNKLVQELPSRDKAIIKGRLEGITLKELGTRYNISRERVRQIEEKTIIFIKSKLSKREEE